MQNNKLIAEFMELPIVEHDGMWYNPEDTSMKFNYDTSWDWLMPVVEKIERVNELISGHILSTDIDKTYKEVVRFIKTYNDVQTLREDAQFINSNHER